MRRRHNIPRHPERGSALLVVFLMAAAVAIMLYTELPVATFEARRAKEEQLEDRGNQYAHAIKLYVHAFGHYPPSLEALEDTNRTRFLRHQLVDPFTGKADWRLLHAGPGGVLADSKVNPLANSPASSDDTPPTSDVAVSVVPRRAPAIPANAGADTSNVSVADGSSLNSETNPDPTQSLLPSASADVPSDSPALSAFAGPQLMAGGIAGVASTAQGHSIKAFNKQTDYSLWEFFYDPLKDRMSFGLGIQNGLAPGDPATHGAPGFSPPAVSTSPLTKP